MMVFCPLCGSAIGKNERCGCRGKKRNNQGSNERGYDAQWAQLSKRIRQNEPFCRRCNEQGRTRAARECHHIIPIAADASRRLDPTNIMPVCRECHQWLDAEARGHHSGG